MELLSFGNKGWGDEILLATLITIAVAITALFIGFIFALIFVSFKLSKNSFLNYVGNTYTTVFRGVPELQITLKDTSLISVTGLVELMRQSYIAAGSTRSPLIFYVFAAIIYLILTTISMKFFNKIEKKFNYI